MHHCKRHKANRHNASTCGGCCNYLEAPSCSCCNDLKHPSGCRCEFEGLRRQWSDYYKCCQCNPPPKPVHHRDKKIKGIFGCAWLGNGPACDGRLPVKYEVEAMTSCSGMENKFNRVMSYIKDVYREKNHAKSNNASLMRRGANELISSCRASRNYEKPVYCFTSCRRLPEPPAYDNCCNCSVQQCFCKNCHPCECADFDNATCLSPNTCNCACECACDCTCEAGCKPEPNEQCFQPNEHYRILLIIVIFTFIFVMAYYINRSFLSTSCERYRLY